MVRRTTRRNKRVLVIDFTYTKPDGTEGRYRRDAAVQTMAAATTEEASRKLGATLYGDPERMCGQNGQALRPVDAAPVPEVPKEPTFGETLDRYLAEYAPSALAPSTLDGYRCALNGHVRPVMGQLVVSAAFDVTRSREIDVSLAKSGASASLRRNTLLALRSVARFAVEVKVLPSPPEFLSLPKRGRRVPSAPAPGDVAAMIDAAKYPEHRLVILLAGHAGLRKGEIRALRTGDCEMERNRLVVRRSRYRAHTGPTKSGHEREVPLTPQLREALLAAGVDKRPRDECVALSTRGKPWGSSGPYAALQATLRRLNLPRERLHALRAFFVTTLLNGNVPAHVVRELVGHGDLATTQGYAATVPGAQGVAVGVLDRVYQDARTAAGRKDRPARARPMRRLSRSTVRIGEFRRRVLRHRGSGNSRETLPIAAE
jgi:integrase